jgi:hypothetical protein
MHAMCFVGLTVHDLVRTFFQHHVLNLPLMREMKFRVHTTHNVEQKLEYKNWILGYHYEEYGHLG